MGLFNCNRSCPKKCGRYDRRRLKINHFHIRCYRVKQRSSQRPGRLLRIRKKTHHYNANRA
jgi:hypothetical protein